MGALDGKVAIVTGGGTGIGRDTAMLFAAEGARVVVFGRRPDRLDQTVADVVKAGGQAMAVSGDVARDEDVARLVATATAAYGGIDVLVHAAAIRVRGRFADISTEDFAEIMRVNVVGAFVVTRWVAAPMRQRGGGSIVHVGSALGTVAAPLFSPYIASKGAVHQLARAAAVELVGDGIRVNVVAPGPIETEVTPAITDFRRRMYEQRIPMGRAGHVRDVAHACLYLASDVARYVTGAILAVDGGWTAA